MKMPLSASIGFVGLATLGLSSAVCSTSSSSGAGPDAAVDKLKDAGGGPVDVNPSPGSSGGSTTPGTVPGSGGSSTVDAPMGAGGASSSGGRKASGGTTGSGGLATPIDARGTGTAGTGVDALIKGGSGGNGGTGGSGGNAGGGGSASSSDGGVAQGDLPVGHCGARRGRYFPATSWIYTDISSAPVRANSTATTAWLENAGGWGNSNRFQIDTSLIISDADASTPRFSRTPSDPMPYTADCDPNVSVPIPANGSLEGGIDYLCGDRANGNPDGDCHLLVADFSSNTLFEAYQAAYVQNKFYTSCTVAWTMGRDVWGSPPTPGADLPPVSSRNWGIGRQCTGPDAAGFPIAPLLFTMGDIQSGKVEHAIRFILPNDRMQKAPTSSARSPVFVWPATHAGGPSAISPDAPIYGSRWRLKANFDPASRGLDANNPVVRAVVFGLKHYGMLLADGGNIALTAENSNGCAQQWDDVWGNNGSRVLNGIRPSDFEVLDTGSTDAGWDCVRNAR